MFKCSNSEPAQHFLLVVILELKVYENVYTVRLVRGLHPVSGSFLRVHHFKDWRWFYWRLETGGALTGGGNGMAWERDHLT